MQAYETDKEAVKKLWADAFHEQEPFLSQYFDDFWKSEDALIIKEDKKLVAALEMIPYSVFLRKAPLSAAYIVGVSVAEEFRGRNYSKKIMRECLLTQKKRNMALSLLTPFNYEFYNKLGYRMCYTLDVYELTQDNLPVTEESLPVICACFSDFEKLNSVYSDFCHNKNGYIIRTKQDWKYIFFEHKLSGGGFFAVKNSNSFSGYASYFEKNDEVFVRELIYSDALSLLSLLSKFKAYKKIKIRTVSDMLLLKLIKNPKNVLKTVPTVMARITDIEKILFPHDIEDLKFKITDDLIEENCGTYEKTADKIIKTDSKFYDVSLDIGSFTELILGFSSAEELFCLNKLDCDIKTRERLDKIFPKEKNYINQIMEE